MKLEQRNKEAQQGRLKHWTMSVLITRSRVRHHAAFWWDVFLVMQEDKNPQHHRVLQDELRKLHQEHERLSYICRLYETELKFLESFSLLARRKWHPREIRDRYSCALVTCTYAQLHPYSEDLPPTTDPLRSVLALQPGRPARPDLGGRSLLCPVFPHQFGTHRCLGQPDLGDSGNSILQFRLAEDLVNLILLVAPRQSVVVCATGHLSFQRGRGKSGSLRGWRAVALSPTIVLGENVEDPIAATAVGPI
jgi:hypothetical protein